MSEKTQIPKSWKVFPLPVVATINPPKGKIDAGDSQLAHFVPMACVREKFSGIDVSTTRSLKEVVKGYTAFREGDVLFAKITPCMENGKLAVVPPLVHQLGFGSTEFHVLRATEIALPKWIAHFISQATIRRDAQRSMTGSAGQLRVPAQWLLEQELPIPPLNEQRRIVAKIEELFSDLDAGFAALKRAKANLKRYRAAVLKAAVEGKLTEEWRAEHPAKEPASALLARILKERREKWEADQLAKFAAAGKEPPKNWRDKYLEPSPPDTSNLPELPNGWCWASVGQLITEPTCNGISIKGTDSPPGVPALRLNAMTANGFDYEKRRYIPISSDLATDLAIRFGDLFVSRGNGSLHLVGRGVLAQEPPEEIVFPDTMIRVRLFDIGSLRRFISHVWSSRLIRQQVEKKARTTAGIYKISQRDVEEFVLPLPSKEEQSRIVEEIEEKLTQISAAEQLVEADLLRAARLRQSILKQAFEGKLVPQDPNDEPASVLLERLRASHLDHDTKNKVKNNARPAKRKKSERMVDK